MHVQPGSKFDGQLAGVSVSALFALGWWGMRVGEHSTTMALLACWHAFIFIACWQASSLGLYDNVPVDLAPLVFTVMILRGRQADSDYRK